MTGIAATNGAIVRVAIANIGPITGIRNSTISLHLPLSIFQFPLAIIVNRLVL